MHAFTYVDPCGYEATAWTVGVIAKDGKFADHVFCIRPAKCLHAFCALGTQLRGRSRKGPVVVGRGWMRDVVMRFGV